MKSIGFASVFMLAAPAFAQSATLLGFDGCYQLYMPGSMFPAFCLQGTAEEGIGGAGVRLAIFGTNTSRVVKCARSSASRMTENSFEFHLDGRKEMALTEVQIKNQRKAGFATFGSTRLNFAEFGAPETSRLLAIANGACR